MWEMCWRVINIFTYFFLELSSGNNVRENENREEKITRGIEMNKSWLLVNERNVAIQKVPFKQRRWKNLRKKYLHTIYLTRLAVDDKLSRKNELAQIDLNSLRRNEACVYVFNQQNASNNRINVDSQLPFVSLFVTIYWSKSHDYFILELSSDKYNSRKKPYERISSKFIHVETC